VERPPSKKEKKEHRFPKGNKGITKNDLAPLDWRHYGGKRGGIFTGWEGRHILVLKKVWGKKIGIKGEGNEKRDCF